MRTIGIIMFDVVICKVASKDGGYGGILIEVMSSILFHYPMGLPGYP